MSFKIVKLLDIASIIKKYDNFVICGHINPDADCVGSQIALSLALDKLKKESICLLANEDKVDKNLNFLKKTKNFINAKLFLKSDIFSDFKKQGFCFVSVDVQSNYRIANSANEIKKNAIFSFTIDHHQQEEACSNFVYVDPSAASNSLLIWDFCKLLNIEIDEDIACACYTGLCGDTNGFTNTNTDYRSFKAATEMSKYGINAGYVAKNLFQTRSLVSLNLEKIILDRLYVDKKNAFALSYLTDQDFKTYNAKKQDADYMIDLLRSLDCADFVCVLRQQQADEKIHGSLRSKTNVDVSKIACQYLGGGHKAAAGFTMDETNMNKALEDVKKKMINIVKDS